MKPRKFWKWYARPLVVSIVAGCVLLPFTSSPTTRQSFKNIVLFGQINVTDSGITAPTASASRSLAQAEPMNQGSDSGDYVSPIDWVEAEPDTIPTGAHIRAEKNGGAPVYEKKSRHSQVVWTLNRFDEIPVEPSLSRNGWFQVDDGNGRSGFVRTSDVVLIQSR